jgi:hypothetical protein
VHACELSATYDGAARGFGGDCKDQGGLCAMCAGIAGGVPACIGSICLPRDCMHCHPVSLAAGPQ